MKKRKITVYICLILVVFTALIGAIYASGLHSDTDCGKPYESFCPRCNTEMTLCCSTQKCTDENLCMNAYYCENCGFFERGSHTDYHNESHCTLPKLTELVMSEKNDTSDSLGESSAIAAADQCGVCGNFGCEILH